MSKQLTEVPVLFPDNASLSDPIAVGGHSIVGVKVPSGWVTAAITFQALLTSSGNPVAETYGDVKDEAGAEVSLAAQAASTVCVLQTKRLEGLNRIKVRSGTSGAAVSQTGGPLTVVLILGD